MSKFVLFLSLFVSHYSFAQSAEMIEIHNRVLRESGGICSILDNPHSYGCTDWTFKGNNVFPLLPMNWSALGGNWAMVTYADPVGDENKGPEFQMLKQKGRSTMPAGVFDFKSGRIVGDMDIIGNSINFKNWQGQRMSTIPGAFAVLDGLTVQMQAIDNNNAVHMFTCRDFDRINTHHLLCRWDSRSGNRNFEHKGYVGFLRTGN